MWKIKIAQGEGPWLSSTNNHVGRQYWEFDPEAGTREERAEVERLRKEFTKNRFKFKQSADLLMRMQLAKENPRSGEIEQQTKLNVKNEAIISREEILTTLRRAISFYSTIQAHDGHWPAESSGLLFFLPPLVIALHLTGDIDTVFSSEHRKEILRYIYNHQNEDGGWGLHIEGHSTMFGSCLTYVALRLLGQEQEDGEDRAVARGRKWILDHGGAVEIPAWGKIWLTVLGAHEWEGCNPIPPECWLLPNFLPIHPGKWLSYARTVYMPLSYVYGKRYVGPITAIAKSLRKEIYTELYQEIDWNRARTTCAKEDLYYPHPLIQDMLWGFLYYFAEPVLTRWPFTKLREKALKVAMEHVHYEDENSRYLCTGAIEKALCLFACYVENPEGEEYKRHLARIPDFLWVAEDGMKMQSVGSQTWDAAFSVQAIISSNLAEEYASTLRKAHGFLKASQIRDNPSGDYVKMYRHTSKGSWAFASQDHGWQVSDCTGEGLTAVLLLSQISPGIVGKEMESECLYDAVNVLLSIQSSNGGFTAWEPQRAFGWVEKLNPIEFFEDCLIEREYVECTASAIKALTLFRKLHPGHRTKEIDICVAKAMKYIEDTQNPDGSWYGCWGICYTYGAWYAVDGLSKGGANYDNSLILRKSCDFLLSKQLPDGGWGESLLSSTNKVYTNLPGNRSNVVHTSWALLSLIHAGQAQVDPEPIHRGIRLLVNSQNEDGYFPQQEFMGVFMKNCLLNFACYRDIFPIWALGEYRRVLSVENKGRQQQRK